MHKLQLRKLFKDREDGGLLEQHQVGCPKLLGLLWLLQQLLPGLEQEVVGHTPASELC